MQKITTAVASAAESSDSTRDCGICITSSRSIARRVPFKNGAALCDDDDSNHPQLPVLHSGPRPRRRRQSAVVVRSRPSRSSHREQRYEQQHRRKNFIFILRLLDSGPVSPWGHTNSNYEAAPMPQRPLFQLARTPACKCKSPGPWWPSTRRFLLILALVGLEQLRSRKPPLYPG